MLRGEYEMKNYLISLVNQIEDIRKLAREEHISGFFESDFVMIQATIRKNIWKING